MKIAISSNGPDLEDSVAELFGRCPYFIFVQVDGGKMGKVQALENKSMDQSGGAGISAAKFLAEMDASAVIAQNIGPRAVDVLKQFNIETYDFSGTISAAIQKFIAGELNKTN
jgi:predicted Fe-Mo cluster-binding NifX family protein